MDIRHAVGVKTGIPDATLAALPTWQTSPAFDPRERAALALATQVVREDEDVTDECFEALRAHFTEAQIVELVFIVGYQTFASKFAKAFRLPPQGFVGDEAVA
jgi:alkylhydroperoxidase family enzyme